MSIYAFFLLIRILCRVFQNYVDFWNTLFESVFYSVCKNYRFLKIFLLIFIIGRMYQNSSISDFFISIFLQDVLKFRQFLKFCLLIYIL